MAMPIFIGLDSTSIATRSEMDGGGELGGHAHNIKIFANNNSRH